MTNLNKYCFQLDQLNAAAINEKCLELLNRNDVKSLQDNSKKIVFSRSESFHSSAVLNIAPLNYHLFQSLQNFLKIFKTQVASICVATQKYKLNSEQGIPVSKSLLPSNNTVNQFVRFEITIFYIFSYFSMWIP